MDNQEAELRAFRREFVRMLILAVAYDTDYDRR